MRYFLEDRTEELWQMLQDPDLAARVAEVRDEMDEDDQIYLAARRDGFTDLAARELVNSLGQVREARKQQGEPSGGRHDPEDRGHPGGDHR